jgi:hypothetical protein
VGRESEDEGVPPSLELFKKAGELGILAIRLGPGPHLKGRTLPGDISPTEFGESASVFVIALWIMLI